MRQNRTMSAETQQPKAQSSGTGQAAAAQKFREWEARNRDFGNKRCLLIAVYFVELSRIPLK